MSSLRNVMMILRLRTVIPPRRAARKDFGGKAYEQERQELLDSIFHELEKPVVDRESREACVLLLRHLTQPGNGT